jgi:hypothetical protein
MIKKIRNKKTDEVKPGLLKIEDLWIEDKGVERKWLFDMLKKDRQTARICLLRNPSRFDMQKICIAKYDDGKIIIFQKTESIGMSVTNKIFYRSKTNQQIIIKENGKKFWYTTNDKIRPLFAYHVKQFPQDPLILNYISMNYPWTRFLFEYSDINISLNTVVSKKLFSYKRLLSHFYKLNYPMAKLILETGYNKQSLKLLLKYSIGHENINKELFLGEDGNLSSHPYLLSDTLRIAELLNKRINLSWSKKRLKGMHDNWAEQLTEVVFVNDNCNLKISKVFQEFADLYGYELLTDTKCLAMEGKRQKHCVASYDSKVNHGDCAISTILYDDKRWTLELGKQGNSVWVDGEYVCKLKILQFRGFINEQAPMELFQIVQKRIDEFNTNIIEPKLHKQKESFDSWSNKKISVEKQLKLFDDTEFKLGYVEVHPEIEQHLDKMEVVEIEHFVGALEF